MADLFSHRTGQAAQVNLLVNLKLLNSHCFCNLCIFSKIVTHFLSYGPPQVLGVLEMFLTNTEKSHPAAKELLL